jgi:hypothetical protein
LTLENLTADAMNIMSGLGECWSTEAAITHTADVLLRIHPGVNRELAILASEQARWAGWP